MILEKHASKKILFLGYGDLAQRTQKYFELPEYLKYGVARSNKFVNDDVNFWRGSISDFVLNADKTMLLCDIAVITLTPGGRREEDYNTAYLQNVRLILDAWKRLGHQPGCIIFASSSSVYGQSSGEWVNEDSETMPTSDTANVLLKTEALLQASNIPSCALRFSGIYGPGRHFLVKQVLSGKFGDNAYTNRIHSEDCAAIIAFLVKRFLQDKYLPNVILASDGKPVSSSSVRQWIANFLTKEGLNIESVANDSTQKKRTKGMNKRCDNSRLLKLGYRLKYPSYKDGFPEIIREYLKDL